MKSFEYVFTALKGIQAGRAFYVAMCPLKLVPKIFLFQEQELPAELRAQRVLNRARIPEIAAYIIGNPGDYVFSSITASIDGKVAFEPVSFHGERDDNIGRLRVPMDARIIINDGQHRRAAIEAALEERPELADETISVVFFIDAGMKRSQQMFADLNKHAVRPTRSIGILYDHRDSLSTLARKLVDAVPVFQPLTEVEKTSISNRSTKLFTLSAIYEGTLALLRKSRKTTTVTDADRELAVDFWNHVCEQMGDWKLAAKKQASPSELRKEFVHAHGLAIQAIGRLGASLLSSKGHDYRKELKQLSRVDWSRRNTAIWEGRALIGGRISKAHACVTLTTNYLKKLFDLELSPDEHDVECQYLKSL